DAPDEGDRQAAAGRLLPRPRSRRRPGGARGAQPRHDRPKAPRPRRRGHDRARSLPPGLRRCAPRGPRPRYGGGPREPDAVPLRPAALSVATVAERPELLEPAWLAVQDVLPEYNNHGDVLNVYWGRLTDELPEFQFHLVHDEEPVARARSIP